MMTIEEIRTGKEGQTFDLKSIQIDPKALAIPIYLTRPEGLRASINTRRN